MVDAEPTQSDDALASAPSAPMPDWANVRGFQVVATAGSDADASPADPASHAHELAKELSARAARFAQSVDGSIVLASDGLIRWLGDPIARLIAGEDLLTPRAVLLADEALSEEARTTVTTRLDLWLSAYVGKVLGPLQTLADPGEVAEPVRALGARIAQALGVLERERVRQQVKALDQGARSTLRKLGVRFGSLYIFVPALLKPGARTLCSQLWGLRRGEAGAERLLAFAAAGRTSFAAEAPLAADTYRVAGFRLCGDRVVRIDIVERLTDLIRAAIPDHMRSGGGLAPEASGFVVSAQMTSLTGCAGEAFASILRSLGYESHRVRKSDFEAAMRKPASTTPIQAAPAAEAPADEASAAEVGDTESSIAEARFDAADSSAPAAESPADEASAAEAGHTEPSIADAWPDAADSSAPRAEAPADEANAAEVGHTESSIADAWHDAADNSAPAAEAPADEASAAEVGHTESSIADARPDAADLSSPAAEDETSAFVAKEPAPAADPEPDVTEAAATASINPADAPETAVAADTAPADGVETSPAGPVGDGQPPLAETAPSAGVESAPAEDEWIEVWRPAPRRRPPPAARAGPSASPGESEGVRPSRQARDARRRWSGDNVARRPEVSADAARTETPAPAAAEIAPTGANEEPRGAPRREGGAPHRREGGRRHPHKGARAEEARPSEPTRGARDAPNAPGKKEHRPAPVDMDSPFAKLLALKPLLERRDKRT